MSRMAATQKLFGEIRENPEGYLTDISLRCFEAFWNGYTSREPFGDAGMNWFSPAGFHDFVSNRYKNDSTHGAVSVVSLYSRNHVEAWKQYFDLLDEFNTNSPRMNLKSPANGAVAAVIDFGEVVQAVIERPAMYVGTGSFKLVAEFLSGWLRATPELGYEESEYERSFKRLLRYIEEFDINLPGPPWHAILWFWTMNDKDAFEMFAGYIDEFVTKGKSRIKRIEFHMERRLLARQNL